MRRLLIAGTLVAGLFVSATATQAGASTGRDYGQHVAACAQAMGFNGTHNPGMHHGFAGWDGTHCEM
jgi:hypothetical protein